DAVSVMTVHQAKGLEFDVVVVPHLVAGRFPAPPRVSGVLTAAALAALRQVEPAFHDPGHQSPERHFAEEERLLYVAIARARERLVLSWARRYDGEEDDSAPSPLLLGALGGREVDFWRRVHDEKAAATAVLADLAAASRAPRIELCDTDRLSGTLEAALDLAELEVALRRRYQRGDPALRARLERARAGEPARAAGVELAFVTAAEPFPREEERPLA